jgi:hypothetical protein
MDIIYLKKNNIPSNICKKEKTFFAKAGSGNLVYIVDDTIIKVFDKKDNEIDNYLRYIETCKNTLLKQHLTYFDFIAICPDKKYIIGMQKNDHDLTKDFLRTISNKIQVCLLYQCLLTIYTFNHTCKIFFNDIYLQNTIRNVMVNRENTSIHSFINVPKCGYSIKFIDYGHISTEPKLRTLQYILKYFPILKQSNIYSEVVLFTFFYGIALGYKKKDLLIILNNVIKQIKTKNSKKFDEMFIKFIYKNNIYINK